MAQQTPKIKAEVRDRIGTRYAVRLRKSGKLPGVIYGHKQDPVHVALDGSEMITHMSRGTHLLEVEHASGDSETCLIKNVQYNYLGDDVIHVDLTRVDMTEDLTVMVRLEIKGEAACPGLKEAGAFLEHPMSELEVICRALDIPESIVVDVSELEVGQNITVGDLTMPPNVRTEQASESTVASIHVAKEEEEVEEETPEETAAGEPEVLTERREDAEGEPPVDE